MKIAFIVSMFPCWSETFILREMIWLEKQGIELTVFSLKPCHEKVVHPEADRFVKEGKVFYPTWSSAAVRCLVLSARHPVQTIRLLVDFLRTFHGSVDSFLKSLATLVLSADFIPILRAKQISHLHAPWGTYPSTAGLLLSRLGGVPFSLTLHAHDIFLEDHALAIKFKEAHFARTISEYNRQLLLARYPGIVPQKLHVVHCGLNPAEFHMTSKPAEPPVLLSIGRLAEIKGLPDLIEACGILAADGVPFRCLIVGEGPLRARLERQIQESGLGERVRLMGALDENEVKAVLARASVFILPCVTTADGDQDGIPNSLMEAMAVGIPVVTTATSGIPELIEHQVTGLLVPQRDPQALAHAVTRLLTDSVLRANLTRNGRNKIHAEFHIGTATKELVALFGIDGDQRTIASRVP